MKRREFVIKSGLATAAIGTPSFMESGMTYPKKAADIINLGVIGAGDRGAGLINIMNDIPELNVICCCDILPFRLQKGIANTSGKAKGYSDYRKLLEQKDIDAILVATPFNTHSQIAIDAIDAGKHVFCEKTMAKGFDGIIQLRDKVNNSDKIFQTGHQYHSSRLYRHVVDLIQNGKVGKVTAIECQWNRNGNWRRPVTDSNLERAINWRMYREYSGGLVAELCSHQIDFTNWVLNASPDQVLGVGGIDYWKDGRETFDNVHLIYTYPDGVKATFTCLTSNSKDDYQIKVMGDKGTLILDYVNAWFFPEGNYKKEIQEIDGVSGATIKWDEGKGIPLDIEHADPSTQALIDFKNNILNNTVPTSNVTTGAKAAVCVQMGLDAMYNNKIVQWNKTLVL
ncbi:MAG: Gfo/Idh/MocA family oxidoreductase [Eudoraea sp.]|uniref:Gfo/Idh/MocA family protein n=1 Tax=Eudoraea sp. TaxID=1979955 RepID=UPI003C795386